MVGESQEIDWMNGLSRIDYMNGLPDEDDAMTYTETELQEELEENDGMSSDDY